jgi:hypothetical protein
VGACCAAGLLAHSCGRSLRVLGVGEGARFTSLRVIGDDCPHLAKVDIGG